MKLINTHRQPVTLDDGTILAAAGTDGSTKTVVSVSDRDRRRYVDRGLVTLASEEAATPFEPAVRPATEQEEAEEADRRATAPLSEAPASRKETRKGKDVKEEEGK